MHTDSNNQIAIEQRKKAKAKLFVNSIEETLPAPTQAEQLFRLAKFYHADNDYENAIEAVKGAIAIAQKAGILYSEAEKLLASLNDYANSNQRKVFISYSRSDIDIASNIYMFLHEKGFNVWIDKFNLVAGQDWKLEIHNNIKSSDFFIACLSKNSVSKRGYVQKELKEAISVLEEMPEGEIYIIPIRIDDCTVPSFLTDRHWLDWSDKNAKKKLLQSLNSKK